MDSASPTSRARLDLDSTERFVWLRKELGVTSFGISQMVLEPGQRGRIHRHERQEEVYLVLQGELTVNIEGEETVLERGELIRVAPEVRRQLSNPTAGKVIVLALGGQGTHESRDGVGYESWDDTEGASPKDVPLPPDLPVGD